MNGLEFTGYMTPYLGTAMVAGDIITGKTNTGCNLSPADRILLLASLIPIDRIAIKSLRIAKKVAPLIRGAEHVAPKLNNSRRLGKALEVAGEVAHVGDAAHHIVPSGHPLAENARKLLDEAGIGINEAENGIFLPNNRNVYHVGSYHADTYPNLAKPEPKGI